MSATQRLEPVECPHCWGQGILEEFVRSGGDDYHGYYPVYRNVPCDTCEGQGNIWMTIHTNDDLEALYWDLDCHDYYQLGRAA